MRLILTIRVVLKSKNGAVRTSTMSVAGRTLKETVENQIPGGTPLQSSMVFDRQ